MAPDNRDIYPEGPQIEKVILQNIVDSLQVIFYISEFEYPGDIRSVKNLWLNQPGLDFIGCTQKELSQLGFEFFRTMLHPDDLERLMENMKSSFEPGLRTVIIETLRIRLKKKARYRLFTCSKSILETFEDGLMKKVLIVASEIRPGTAHGKKRASRPQDPVILTASLPDYHLTPREQQILQLIVNGKRDNEIADQLFISIFTAKKHRTNLVHKYGVPNSAALVAMAVESGEYLFENKRIRE